MVYLPGTVLHTYVHVRSEQSSCWEVSTYCACSTKSKYLVIVFQGPWSTAAHTQSEAGPTIWIQHLSPCLHMIISCLCMDGQEHLRHIASNFHVADLANQKREKKKRQRAHADLGFRVQGYPPDGIERFGRLLPPYGYELLARHPPRCWRPPCKCIQHWSIGFSWRKSKNLPTLSVIEREGGKARIERPDRQADLFLFSLCFISCEPLLILPLIGLWVPWGSTSSADKV